MPSIRKQRLVRCARRVSLAGLAALLFLGVGEASPATAEVAPVTVTNYTDPGQAPAWSQRSYWKQPWRSYLDTVPAATLLHAVGINFNVTGKQAAATAKLLAESGFTRARFEVGWAAISYDEPDQMIASIRAELIAKLAALRDNGIRPLILINANHGKPCPTKPATLSLLTAAEAGSTQVRLDPATIELGEIIPGRTGITASGVAANYIITSVDAYGRAQLSKPLKAALSPGSLNAVTLRYEPFSPAALPDGSPNPRFQSTMSGWLNYVRVVMREVESVLGSDDFDVEIWNELSFGSNFLNINNYYQPPIEPENPGHQALLEGTINYLRDPANGVAGVGIGNGFANQSPHGVGVLGTAIDKHPYAGLMSFPEDRVSNGIRPLNALGEQEWTRDELGHYLEPFTPTFDSFFPEYFLSAIQTETLIYDLAPYESTVGGASHGREVLGPGAKALSPVWVTEVNLDPAAGPIHAVEMTAQDVRHQESKIILRYLVSFVNKGVKAIDFYAANAGRLSLIDQAFFSAANTNPSEYPGEEMGGTTTDAVRRLTAAMQGAEPIASPRSLSLLELTDYSSNVQFEGDGTEVHSPLYNRDVFAFFPFQVNEHRFVIPVYVMTRDVAKVYRLDAPGTDPSRFDLPPERYRMAIGGVDGVSAQVSATDPLTDETIPVDVLSRSSDEVVVEMKVTDSPRLLTIQEETPTGSEPATGGPTPKGQISAGSQSVRGGPAQRTKVVTPMLHLQLRSRRSLLRRRKLTVLAICEEACKPQFRGSLRTGQHIFPMRATSRRPRLRPARTRATTQLVIGRHAERSARRALRSGVRVSVIVKASARNASGNTTSSRRVLVLRP